MNYAELEQAWRSPLNRLTPAEIAALHARLTGDLRRRRRGTALFLAVVIGGLTLITGRFAWWMIGPGRAEFDPVREWGAVTFLCLPWLAAVGLAVAYWRHRSRHPDLSAPLAGIVRALLDENRVARSRCRAVAWLQGTALILLPVVVWQLRAAGKAGDEILVPAFVIWPLIAGGVLFGLRRHVRRTLEPRRLELEGLLGEWERVK